LSKQKKKKKHTSRSHAEYECILGEYVLGPAHVFPLIKHVLLTRKIQNLTCNALAGYNAIFTSVYDP
jgi:hypothetical protein